MESTTDKNLALKNEFYYPVSNFYINLCYFFGAIILECVQFFSMGFGIFPSYLFLDIGIILIFCGVIALLPNKITKQIICTLLLLIQMLLNVVNLTLYNIFGSVLTLNMLKLGAEAANAFSFSFLNFFNIAINLFIFGICIFLIFFLPTKSKQKILLKRASKYALVLICFIAFEYCGLLFYNLTTTSLNGSNLSVTSDDYLYNSLFLSTESYKKFGTYGYYFKSLSNKVNNINKITDQDEQDALIKQLNESNNFSENTEMSGKMKNCNVVSILLESFDTFAINPIFTPNMYALSQSAVNFTQFYGRNKTNVNEGIALLGSFPSEDMPYSIKQSVGLSLPYSLPNLMKADAKSKSQTIKTGYYHSYLANFYNRDKTHYDFGFDEVVGLEEIYGFNPTKSFDDRVLDTECFSKVIDQILPTDVDRFYSQISTMTTHGSYDVEVPVFEEYETYVDQNYSTYCLWLEQNNYVVPTDETFEKEFKTYLARTIDTDNMIKMLLDQMEKRGLADNTIIVMYADHAPYYNDLGIQIKGISKDEYYCSESNHLPLIMYAKALGSMQISTFCSHYDIYPTLCDLIGLSYNSAITQGRSVFASDSERSSMFVSFLSGMYNKDLFSSNIVDITSTQKANNIDDIDTSEIEKFKQDAQNFYIKQALVEKVWANNLFG